MERDIDKDYGTLPNSSKMENDEMVGFKTEGYIDKKGTPTGLGAKFNYMPPGQNILDQFVADLRDLPMKTITDMGYPGDGWEGMGKTVVRKKDNEDGVGGTIKLPLAE